MVKSFKKGLAMVLAAAMVFSTPIAVNKTVALAGTTTAVGEVVTLPTETADEVPAVNGTNGNGEPTTWWTSFSNYYKLTGDFDVTFNIKPGTFGDGNWQNVNLIIANDKNHGSDAGEGGVAAEEGYVEYGAWRSDQYGWGTGYQACSNSWWDADEANGAEAFVGEWTDWVAAMKAGTLQYNIQRTNNSIKIVEKLMSGDKTYDVVYESKSGLELPDDLRIFFVSDNSSFTITSFVNNDLELESRYELAADSYNEIDNPLLNSTDDSVTVEYTINLNNDAAANGWDGVLSFYDPETKGRVSFQTHPYVCWNAQLSEGNKWIDYKANTATITSDTKGTDVNYKIVIATDGITMYRNGEEIASGITGQSPAAETNEVATSFQDAIDFIKSAPKLTIGVGLAKSSFWNTEKCVLSNIKVNGQGIGTYVEKANKVDMVKDASVAISEDGKNINLTFAKGEDVTDTFEADNIVIKVGDEVVPASVEYDEEGKATVSYEIPEAGTYNFTITASKNEDDNGKYKDDVETASITVIADGDKFYTTDSSLIETALAIGQTDEAFTITYKAVEGATATLTVKDSSNKEVAVADGAVKKSALKDGETYTVDLKVTKGTTIATAKDTFTYNAPKQAEATSKWAKIKTQPLLFWEFNSATENGMKLTGASIAKTSDGNNVLQLGKDVGIQHESYAQLPSLTSYDFSKGMTVTMDVNVTGWTDNGWTKFFVFGNGTLGKDPVAGEVAYGYTLGLNNVLDYDDWNHKTGYYGTGVAIDKGTELGEETAPLGTSDLQLVWDWYSNTAKQNRWDTITITVSPDGTLSTYYDGTLVQQYKNADFTMILDAMKKATTNYLGTSYYPDPDYVGQMDNFAIYNTALSAADVKTLTGDVVADKTETAPSGTDPGISKNGTKAAPSFMDGPTVSKNRKKITVEFSVKPTKVTESTGKGTVKISGKKVTITYKSALKLGTKVKVTAYNDTASNSKTVTVKGTITIKSVKAKKNTKKVTGKLSVKKATVKVRIKYKGKKKYTKYKKAKVSGKKFTFKAKKMKKGTKVQIKVTKKNYKTKTKTVKVK